MNDKIASFVFKNNWQMFLTAILIVLLSVSLIYLSLAYAASVTLTATVAAGTLTFSVATDVFGTVTPGTYKIATSTLSVTTNNAAGWNVTLSGDDQAPDNTVMDLTTDAATGITDQTEWVPGAATTSAGNAVVRGSLDSSGEVLAFRVMSASSSNGTAFLAPTWWGTDDEDGNAKWAGIASSTVSRQIGNAGTGSYSATAHLNTVQYYLNVPVTQLSGDYSGALTYTASAN